MTQVIPESPPDGPGPWQAAMKPWAIGVSLAALLSGVVALAVEAGSAWGLLFLTPFSLGPLLVNVLLAGLLPDSRGHAVLLGTSILYGLWFGFAFVQAFHVHLDPQSPIALLFVGAYSMPVMLPAWAAVAVIAIRSSRK